MYKHITLCIFKELFNKTMLLLGFDTLFEPIIIVS